MIKRGWRKVRGWLTLTRLIGLVIGLVGLGVAISGSRYVENTVFDAIKAFYANAGSELISIAITVLVIDALNQRRATSQERDALILQMGSPDNAFAVEAVRILRVRGWLEDGALQEADLGGAHLQGAFLFNANLREANLVNANLQEAQLRFANLQGAALDFANLQGAYLWYVDLQGANLRDTQFNEGTTLPDHSKWTPDTDMSKFTYPGHPEFWRSDDPDSPAYRGDDD